MQLFLNCPPGLEPVLLREVRAMGWTDAKFEPGGVTFEGDLADVVAANRDLRGATRVLARIGTFRAFHLSQLDKRARKFAWGEFLRPDVPVRVEVVCKRSKIYHSGAARQRIERAISEELGAKISEDAAVCLKVRIEDDLVTLSIDTSGDSLHKRGHKVAVGKAPMRETLAALFLMECGFDGRMPVVDPMCGSGTFVIEAAEMALGLAAGRSRGFAYELLALDMPAARSIAPKAQVPSGLRFFGYDRNAGAIDMARANAERAGVSDISEFVQQPISDLTAPDTEPGLVIVNPPYGSRIGNKKQLYGLYATLGERLKDGFPGWKVGIITSDTSLARSTGLPGLKNGPPIPHGGLKVRLFQSQL